MSALHDLAKPSNWGVKMEYGPHGGEYVNEWDGGPFPDVDTAAVELAALEKFRADVLAIGDMNAADFAKWQYVKMLIDEQKGR